MSAARPLLVASAGPSGLEFDPFSIGAARRSARGKIENLDRTSDAHQGDDLLNAVGHRVVWEVALLEERIASVTGASVTAIQAVYVPADDFTDPAVTAISAHMDSIIMLSRDLAAQAFYPAIDPLASSSVLLDPLVVGAEHYALAERAREALARLKDLQDIISLLGVDELSASDQLVVERARRLQRFLSQPFVVTQAFTGTRGRSVSRTDTLAGCRAILDGETDDWAEASLYMVGNLGEARQKETKTKAPKP